MQEGTFERKRTKGGERNEAARITPNRQRELSVESWEKATSNRKGTPLQKGLPLKKKKKER